MSMSGTDRLENVNPRLFEKSVSRPASHSDWDDHVDDPIDAREVFELIKDINDPEHPLTLEELNVVDEDLIKVDAYKSEVDVTFTPTIPHCSMATLIGLAIRVQLLRCLPQHFKVTVKITPGSHSSENAINKQLADKERVAAAMENGHLLQVVDQCLKPK